MNKEKRNIMIDYVRSQEALGPSGVGTLNQCVTTFYYLYYLLLSLLPFTIFLNRYTKSCWSQSFANYNRGTCWENYKLVIFPWTVYHKFICWIHSPNHPPANWTEYTIVHYPYHRNWPRWQVPFNRTLPFLWADNYCNYNVPVIHLDYHHSISSLHQEREGKNGNF